MKRLGVIGICALALSACGSTGGGKSAFMASPVGMSHQDTLQRQRPAFPNSHAIAFDQDDRLHASVTVDYVSGMSQRSYFFAEANQLLYRPMLEWSLERAGLRAPTRTAARYALQVEFNELESQKFGLNFAGKSHATYRIVHRASGTPVYERKIASNFLAVYPKLNERDAAKAYQVSAPPFQAVQSAFATFAIGDGVIVETINNVRDLRHFFDGPIEEASQATWNDAYQTYLWGTGLSALAGPALVAAENLNPTNFIALNDYNGVLPHSAPAGAIKGALSESGIGSRDGRERAAQVNAQMMAQSLTKFIVDLALEEEVQMTLRLPCLETDELADMRHKILLAGHRYTTDNCLAYERNGRDAGFQFNNW